MMAKRMALLMLSGCLLQVACGSSVSETKAPAYWVDNPSEYEVALEKCERGTMSAETCATVYQARNYFEAEARQRTYKKTM